jgi:hypothetical protein
MRNDLRSGKLTIQELREMKEEALKERYGASRNACRRARKAVLSES